ncbi:MAG: hypothetical protein HY392_00855 [Candidatus Diapherotrites archaeon]|nr:hypothetical protein [Candidatus Diapherotrites archaeon]
MFLQFDLAGAGLGLGTGAVFLALSFFVLKHFNESFSGEKDERALGAAHEKELFILKKRDSQKPGAKQPEAEKAVGQKDLRGNTTIISTIQQLLRNATPEEEIVKNLHDMGLDDSSARKMVMIAQSDALEVFRDEIEKITQKNVQEQLQKIQAQLDVPPEKSVSQKIENIKKNLGVKLAAAEKKTSKPREKIALGLLSLEERLEEITVPELKKSE